MESPDKQNENASRPPAQPQGLGFSYNSNARPQFDLQELKEFFGLTGGSILYCISAVCVACGIVKLLGPVLAGDKSFMDALPCIGVLHLYELALLGVLIFIVSRKIVDDAISISVLMALFLVGTSIALGSIADKNVNISLWVGFAGIALALAKFHIMRRFAGISFKGMSFLGLTVLISANYLGPNLLARSVATDPSQEPVRRTIWLFAWLAILLGGALILIEAIRDKSFSYKMRKEKIPFLNQPVMAYVFAFIVICASGVHQYATEYTFALERVSGDYVPVVALASLLLVEILSKWGERFGPLQIIIYLAPLTALLLAINDKSILASSEWGIGLICYPPVILAITGLAIAGLAFYHHRLSFAVTAVIYGLGVILTAGFSPENPYDLNVKLCLGTLTAILIIYGAIIKNQYVCVAGLAFLCMGLLMWQPFLNYAGSLQLTNLGGAAGIFGLSLMVLYLLFGSQLDKRIRVTGALCLGGFILDYLPDDVHIRYLIVLCGLAIFAAVLWFRFKDLPIIVVLCLAPVIRLYILARHIAYWRLIIVGFLLLGAGTVVSMLKSSAKDKEDKP